MDFSFFKRHPYITGGVVIIGGLVFISLSGWFGGGSSQAYVASGPSEASIAASAQNAMAQLASATQLEQARIGSNTAIELASMSLDLESLKTLASKEVALASVGSQDKQTAAQLEAIRIASTSALENSRINAGIQQAQFNLQDTIAARDQYTTIQGIIAQRETNAFQYQLQYANEQRDDANTAELIKLLGQKVA